MRFATHRHATIFVSLVLAATLAACGGGEKDVKSELSVTKTGQELIDLQQARDAGRITQNQYDQERGRLLKGN
jgi:hypothetical protein